ncbi:MAG: hypothetical protein HYV18_07550 [Gammaproteobacteria bacterium]|nr:hypothetical protein [Gammaproteobacteria bacterium]
MNRNWIIAAGALALAACSANNQDGGSADAAAPLTAEAVDGPLAFARVYADLNNNHRLDAFEPRALTDRDGFVSRGSGGENYCAPGGRTQHCLRLGRGETAVIRVRGGYDTVTGEPFLGELALRTSGAGGTQLISPITSLLAGDAAEETLRNALGFIGDEHETRYFNDRDAPLLALSQRLHKIVAAIAAQLERQYPDFGDNEDLPRGLAGIVQAVFAERLVSSAASLSDFITQNNLEQVVRGSEQRTRDLLESPPGALTDAQITRIARLALAMSQAANGMFSDGALTDATRNARLRLMEVLLRRANRAADDAGAGAVEDDVDWVTAPGNAAVRDALDNDTDDITRLVDQGLDGRSGTELSDAAARPAGASSLAAIAGKDLSLSFSDEETDAAVRIYFTGSGSSGELIACLRYEDKTDSENSLNTDGLRLSGDWALLNDYSLAVRLVFLGASRSAIIRSLDTESFGFDFDDESRDYDGDAPTGTTDAIPATSEACAESLPVIVSTDGGN